MKYAHQIKELIKILIRKESMSSLLNSEDLLKHISFLIALSQSELITQELLESIHVAEIREKAHYVALKFKTETKAQANKIEKIALSVCLDATINKTVVNSGCIAELRF